MTAKLFLDEDVNHNLAAMLRDAGYDCVSAQEAGMLTASDEEQFRYAVAQDRAILSYNAIDFRRISLQAASDHHTHSGIIISYRQYTTEQLGVLFLAVSQFLNTNDETQLKNALRVLLRPRTTS